MFKLLIECSKDIDTLSINFSDGTSVVTSKDVTKNTKEPAGSTEAKPKEILKSREPKELKERKKLDTYLDTEDDYQIEQEVVKKPEIAELQRPAKVSDELQNLDL
jgi:LAS superfamily LD-carboxypeptidase LdcB